MANEEQLEILKQGVDVWNKWRSEHSFDIDVNLAGADLHDTDLSRFRFDNANLREVNLDGANLQQADLTHAYVGNASINKANLQKATLSDADFVDTTFRESNLCEANLGGAFLMGADFSKACLTSANLESATTPGAIFRNADLCHAILLNANLGTADFTGANLGGADLREANLRRANLTDTDLTDTNLIGANLVSTRVHNARITGSSIYAINVWDLEGEFKEQNELVITPPFLPVVTVDNVKVAQFIYLILNNGELRDVINTLTSKSVLILGRFALPERKSILDGLRNRLREYNLLPIVFDFDRPTDKDFTETVKTLAGLCYFVIADVTNPKSSPLELQATVPDYQIPFVPIIQEGERPFAMMVDLQKKYNWVLNTVSYDSEETLMKVLKPLIIDPAMKKRQELRIIKAQEPEIISAKDFLTNGKE